MVDNLLPLVLDALLLCVPPGFVHGTLVGSRDGRT